MLGSSIKQQAAMAIAVAAAAAAGGAAEEQLDMEAFFRQVCLP